MWVTNCSRVSLNSNITLLAICQTLSSWATSNFNLLKFYICMKPLKSDEPRSSSLWPILILWAESRLIKPTLPWPRTCSALLGHSFFANRCQTSFSEFKLVVFLCSNFVTSSLILISWCCLKKVASPKNREKIQFRRWVKMWKDFQRRSGNLIYCETSTLPIKVLLEISK